MKILHAKKLLDKPFVAEGITIEEVISNLSITDAEKEALRKSMPKVFDVHDVGFYLQVDKCFRFVETVE